MSKILLLGGDGFVGRSFVSLRSGSSELRIISRVSTFLKHDEIVIKDPWHLSEKIFHNADIAFNCFGIAHRTDKENETLFYKINRDLAVDLARKAKAAGVRKFVQMSSMAVYGEALVVNASTPLAPTTHYGRSKAEADAALLELEDENYQVALLRPPMIYGPRAPGNMERLIALVRRLPVLPFANAVESREFLCVDNFVLQAEYAMDSNLSGVFLMKDVKAFCTAELVRIISEELGLKKAIVDFPFVGLLRALLPSYHQRLFGGLVIEGNVPLPSDLCSRFADPISILRETIKAWEDL